MKPCARLDAVRLRIITGLTRPRWRWLARRALPVDAAMLRLTRGHWTFTGLFGRLEVIELTTTGARTGQPRTVVLVACRVDGQLLIVGSNWAGAKHPAWVHNLRATPEAHAVLRGHARRITARELEGAEYDAAWEAAVRAQPWWAEYKVRAAPRRIALFTLEPHSA